MPLIVKSAAEIAGGIRVEFRTPMEYALEMFSGAGYTGLARIDLKHEGRVVASYEGHDPLSQKMPLVHLEESETQHDLARCLVAIKDHAFAQIFKEQTAGRSTNFGVKFWATVNAAEYDLRVLQRELAEKCPNHRLSARR